MILKKRNLKKVQEKKIGFKRLGLMSLSKKQEGVICLDNKLVYCVLIKGWIKQDNLCLGCNKCKKRLEKIKKILEENTKKGDL
jgi:hypothetical protein